ncbi:LOW QUALITY PROTEIN: protein mono-ADP-ribosyltransferase PARP3 [Trichechus inunguis]
MAPKLKARVQSEGLQKGRQGAEEEDSFRCTAEALRAAPEEKLRICVDPACPLIHRPETQVHEDYGYTLNQTNIGKNNNKFYTIQLLEDSDSFICWNRWGHVGEVGQSKLSPFPSLKAAKKGFEKKFQDKTKNKWAEDHFVDPGKYTLIKVQGEDETQEAAVKADGGPVATVVQRVRPCSLDPATQKLITNIFGKDMFKNTMALMNLDVKKMPLGKLSKQQIMWGLEALETLEVALKAPTDGGPSLEELSSHLYAVIPHNFGRTRPLPVHSTEMLQTKKDMLLVPADIELAQTLQVTSEEEKKAEEVPHPLDQDYELLKDRLQLLDSASEDKVVQTSLEQTGYSYRSLVLLHVWKVNQKGEGDRFQARSQQGSVQLLWHGASAAVVAASLTSGLHIMPRSGGCIGKGVSSASENSKSAHCATPPLLGAPPPVFGFGNLLQHLIELTNLTGMSCGAHCISYMFLGEVALGGEHHITISKPILNQPPPGFDSVIARGHTEPDPTQDTELELDGRGVKVPQGQPVPCSEFNSSDFFKSEYLIYNESQCHLRYPLEIHLSYLSCPM